MEKSVLEKNKGEMSTGDFSRLGLSFWVCCGVTFVLKLK